MSITAAEIRDAFQVFDYEGRGYVSSETMKQILAALGFGELSEQETAALIKAMDGDGSGKIDYDAYEKTVIRKRVEPGSPEELIKAFKLIDENGAGKIVAADLTSAAERTGVQMSEREIKSIIRNCAAVDETDAIVYDSWRVTMNQLQATNRKITKF